MKHHETIFRHLKRNLKFQEMCLRSIYSTIPFQTIQINQYGKSKIKKGNAISRTVKKTEEGKWNANDTVEHRREGQRISWIHFYIYTLRYINIVHERIALAG